MGNSQPLSFDRFYQPGTERIRDGRGEFGWGEVWLVSGGKHGHVDGVDRSRVASQIGRTCATPFVDLFVMRLFSICGVSHNYLRGSQTSLLGLFGVVCPLIHNFAGNFEDVTLEGAQLYH